MTKPWQAKPANQQRSQEKRDRILAAMDALLKERPFADIGVVDLARKADVSPATIYQRFSNVEATASVLLVLYFRKVEEWARRPGKQLITPNASLLEALRALATDALEQVITIGHIMRPAYLYSRQRPDRVGKDWARLQGLALQGFRAFLESRSNEVLVEDLDDAAEVLCQLFNFQLLGPLLHGEDASWRPAANRKRFAIRLADVVHRYLAFPH
jgi:AcrR family transcriptional regulator